MRKFFLVGLVVAMAVAVAALAAEMPGKITIKDCADTKTPVVFDHAAHVKAAKDCVTCHHTQKDLTAASAATVAVDKCGKCHMTPEKAETPACSGKKMTDNPYHIGCVACHKEAKKADAATKAPTACTGCHPKAGA
ncbi:MAG: cytochrome c3 family protein [bacterium]|nr:cytochrome c3 family protein [bacterium]